MERNRSENSQRQNPKFVPCVKVMLASSAKIRFFGPGTAQLLSLIEENKSVRLACHKMELSYSKAWKMINAMESELGYELVERRQGGKNGGSAHLTERAKVFLNQYYSFENACKEASEKLFDEHFN